MERPEESNRTIMRVRKSAARFCCYKPIANDISSQEWNGLLFLSWTGSLELHKDSYVNKPWRETVGFLAFYIFNIYKYSCGASQLKDVGDLAIAVEGIVGMIGWNDVVLDQVDMNGV